MDNNKIDVAELDFDLIKSNLKSFLQAQDEFTDYDFEGSSLSILLDILAYNTHYNALYTNLAVNESFLDSASKRNNVVSLAKALGYIPDSARCATATIILIVSNTTSTPTILNLPKYTQFGTTVDGENYIFYTMEDHVAVLNTDNNTYTFSNKDSDGNNIGIQIKEGFPLTFKYQVVPGQKYILPNTDIDLSTLNVRIQNNASSSIFETWVRNENILTLDSTSKVFFVKEIEGEFYELEFGNDIVGKALQQGNIVNIEYMTCNKNLPNGARSFTFQGANLLGGTVSTPITLVAAEGGTDKEGIETVRYNAPRAYATQNRGVTVNDYKSIILSQYSEAESVSVWGGEDNIPPVYGKVFLSIKPKTTNTLSQVQKDFVKNTILKSKNVVSITPEIVDAEYIDVEVDTTVYYNPKATNKGENDIKNLVLQSIKDFAQTNLDSFDGVLRFSKFTSFIDDTDTSIVSNITTIKLHRIVEPKYNVYAQYKIELGNPIYGPGFPEESVLSTGFFVPEYDFPVYLEDLPTDTETGVMRLFRYDVNLDKEYLLTVGTINYPKGSIELNNLNVIGLDGEQAELIIKPQSNDVISIRNQLVRIPDDLINITVVVDRISSGDAAGNSNYIFTTSRN
jgi:hypothetical protein